MPRDILTFLGLVSWAHADTRYLLSHEKSVCPSRHKPTCSTTALFLSLTEASDPSGSMQELQVSQGSPSRVSPLEPWGSSGSLWVPVQPSRAEQPCAGPKPGRSRACKPAEVSDFPDTCCCWQPALSHLQSDLMLHPSRGVTQEGLGLTLSGGVWFGHSPHNCLCLPPPRAGWP